MSQFPAHEILRLAANAYPRQHVVLYAADVIATDAEGWHYYKEVGQVIYSGKLPFRGVHFGRIMASCSPLFRKPSRKDGREADGATLLK